MIQCTTCGNKRCSRADWHVFKCTGSNNPDQIHVVDKQHKQYKQYKQYKKHERVIQMAAASKTNTTLIFEDPPARKHGAGIYSAWLSELRKHPGRWVRHPDAFVPAKASSVATAIKRGTAANTRLGEFDAVVRTVDGTTYLYAQYLNPDN